MKEYIGTKIIRAKEMSRTEYNKFRGFELPENEYEGYLVEYLDEGKANTDEYDNYVSWSPKNVFEKAYKASGNLTFGDALAYLKAGKKLARKEGWNGKGMFIFLVQGSKFKVNRPPLLGIYKEGAEIVYQPHIDMKTANGTIVPWLSSQSDMLAEDWEIVK